MGGVELSSLGVRVAASSPSLFGGTWRSPNGVALALTQASSQAKRWLGASESLSSPPASAMECQ